jgi:hypothetical protein
MNIEASRIAAASFDDPASHVGALLAWTRSISDEARRRFFEELDKRYNKDGTEKRADHCFRDPSPQGACAGPGKCTCDCLVCVWP